MSRSVRMVLLCLACAAVGLACTPDLAPPHTPLPSLQPLAPQGAAAPDVPAELPTAAPLPTLPLLPAAADVAETALGPEVVARVYGTPIARSDFEAQVAQAQVYFMQQPGFDASSEAGRQALLRFRQNYLEVMIDQLIITKAAADLSVEVEPEALEEEVARVRGDDPDALAQWLAASGLTPEGLRSQLHAELITRAVRDAVTASMPRVQPQVRVSHILLADQTPAERALRRLQAGEAFAEVALSLSEDTATRENGGDLGYLPRGVMPPAFDEAAFALAPGQPSGILESEAGLHILLVVEAAADRPVAELYWPAVQQQAFDQWLRAQREATEVLRADLSAASR